MFLSHLKCLRRLERQVKFAKNRCCKIKPVAVELCPTNFNGMSPKLKDCLVTFADGQQLTQWLHACLVNVADGQQLRSSYMLVRLMLQMVNSYAVAACLLG